MKRIGVWLDKKKAHIVTLYDGQTSFNTILSNVENFHSHEGLGTYSKTGPNEVVLEKRNLEREKHEFKKFFETIASEIKNANDIVLFGPSDTAEKFNDELIKSHKSLVPKIRNVAKADSMTKKQVKAWVKDFYKSTS